MKSCIRNKQATGIKELQSSIAKVHSVAITVAENLVNV